MDQVGANTLPADDITVSNNNTGRANGGNKLRLFLNSRSSLQSDATGSATASAILSGSKASATRSIEGDTIAGAPTEINKRYNCMTNNKKLREQCWRMRKVHEEKLKEFELKWITSKRRLEIPLNGTDDSSQDDASSPSSGSNAENKRPVFFSTSTKNEVMHAMQPPYRDSFAGNNANGMRKSLEAMCLPDLNAEQVFKRNKSKVHIKNFTCLSPKSRKLKKEIKRMKKLTLNSLQDATNKADVAIHQDRVGQEMALSVEGMRTFSW